MTFTAFLTHLLFAIGLSCASVALTRFMLLRVRVMDLPNERSSHMQPTPKSGGIAIVATFLIGVAIIFLIGERTQIRQDYFLGFVVSALLIAGVSLYDDIHDKPFIIKLATQFLAVFLVLAFGIVIDQIALPHVGLVELGAWGYPLSFLWIIGL